MTINQALDMAVEHHRAGRLAEAERLYRQILGTQPDNADALHLLGLIASHAGKSDDAVKLITAAIAVNPNIAEYHLHLGTVLDPLGRLDEAIAEYQRVIELNPDLPEAHNNLGNALFKAGRARKSIASFQRALSMRPDYADAHYNLGNVYYDLRLDSQAVDCYQKALEYQPGSVAIYNNLGLALAALRRWDEAQAAYQKALSAAPSAADVFKNLGDCWYQRGEMDQAIANFKQALAARPNLYGAGMYLGLAYKDSGQIGMAIAAYDDALKAFPSDVTTDSARIFAMNLHPDSDSQAILRQCQAWASRHVKAFTVSTDYGNSHEPGRPLRIGYVSPDFRDHVVARNVLPLLRDRDREDFKVFCYANVDRPDAMTEVIRNLCDGWRDILPLDDDRAATLVRDDQIDLLVDLALHTSGSRLLMMARKPAPVQITFAGYPGGTGLSAIDWRLTDPYLDPPGQTDADYVERSYRLPESFWCYDPAAMELNPDEPTIPLPAEHLGFVTFGCLNNFCKTNDAVLSLWGRVLQTVKSSRFRIMTPPGSARQKVIEKLGSMGVVAHRINFVTYQPRAKYLAEFRHIDIGLDTFPYNGHTASLDALWAGVPVVNRIGQTVVGRAGFSQLSNLRLTELAARSDDEFVKIASDLANDLPRLADLRRTLRQRLLQSPLTDAKRFTRNVETAYRDIWRMRCQPPLSKPG